MPPAIIDRQDMTRGIMETAVMGACRFETAAPLLVVAAGPLLLVADPDAFGLAVDKKARVGEGWMAAMTDVVAGAIWAGGSVLVAAGKEVREMLRLGIEVAPGIAADELGPIGEHAKMLESVALILA